MHQEKIRRALWILFGFFAAWLCFKYLLPLLLPFGLGLLLAVAAEPAVRLGTHTLRLPRWAAAGVGVTLTLLLIAGFVGILGAALVKELGVLAGRLPDLQTTAQNTSGRIQSLLSAIAERSPAGIRPLAQQSVDRLFSSSEALLEQVTVRVPGVISSLLSRLPDGALGLGTGILAGFMFSARLPRLKATAARQIPPVFKEKLLPALSRTKTAVFGWLKAHLKLSGITYCIVTVGLLLLHVPFAPVWGAAVALVDAVPLLGTGTVLLPWALICLIEREHFRSVGLLCIYAAAFLTRTVLEPRLVGRHLGLDPLLTLVFLYLGYRLWGIGGMLVTPLLAAAITAAVGKDNSAPS